MATTQPYAAAAGYPAAARYAIPAAVASASPYAPAGYVYFLSKQFVCFSACYLVYIHLRNNSNLFAHFTTRVLKQFQFLHKLIITYSTSKCLWKNSDSEIYIHVLSFMLLFMFEVEDSLHNLLLIIWQNLQWASLCYLLLKTHLYHNFLAKSHCVKKVSTPSFAVVSNKVLQMTATRHWVRIWGWNYSVTVWKV